MASEITNPPVAIRCVNVSHEANTGLPPIQEMERMARRRFQQPKPFKEGNWWWISPRKDAFVNGRLVRIRTRTKVCEANESEREAKRIAAEILRPMNQGLETIGSAMRFADFINSHFSIYLETKASTTQSSYNGTLNKYLLPTFGEIPLRNINLQNIQTYFTGLKATEFGAPTVLKIKEVLSSVLAHAVKHGLLLQNPTTDAELPRNKVVNRHRPKPKLTPEEFNKLLLLIDEPYATMIYVCLHSALRISELIGLRWEDVGAESLRVDERYCRGDWSVPKTEASCATIAVSPTVTERIQKLKTMEVEINWGGKGAKKKFKLVRSSKPNDLVFQSLRLGEPMNDQNILRRHLRPAAEKLKLDPKKCTWHALRRSWATWMVEAGADPKSVQAQLRHSRMSTTMEIYAQTVSEAQRRAVSRTMAMLDARMKEAESKEGIGTFWNVNGKPSPASA